MIKSGDPSFICAVQSNCAPNPRPLGSTLSLHHFIHGYHKFGTPFKLTILMHVMPHPAATPTLEDEEEKEDGGDKEERFLGILQHC